MGNWNSHPEQEVNREPPPTQFQDLDEAKEYHEDVINFNEYGWIYIIGVVLIIFLVLGCCICLCRLGEDKAIPAASKGYQPVAEQEPVVRANTLYAGLPEQMPAQFAMQGQKQPSMMYPVVSPSASMKHGQPYVPQYPPHMYSQPMPPQYGYPQAQPMYTQQQASRDSIYKPVPKAADRTGDAGKSPSPEQKSVLRIPDLSNVEEMSEIGTAVPKSDNQFVFSEEVFEENLIVEESLAKNQPVVNERIIIRKEEDSYSKRSIKSSSASLSSEDSVPEITNEEPFEVIETSQDNPVENHEVNIFFENSQNEAKSDSPRTVISEGDIEEERKKMEENLKKESETSAMPPFTISDFEKHVRGVPDGPEQEEVTPSSSITNVTDVSTEKNISTSQASIDSESTLKSEDLHVRRQETLDAFNEAEKSIHEANENALQVLQTDTEDSLDFQEIDSDLANTLTLTSTTTPVVKDFEAESATSSDEQIKASNLQDDEKKNTVAEKSLGETASEQLNSPREEPAETE